MKTKVAIKNKAMTSFGGIFHIEDEYTRLFSRLIDHSLGLRSKFIGYQYSEIFRSLSMIYHCGGDCLEDITTLGNDLRLRPDSRVPSSDTIARGLKELSEDNIVYTSKSGNNYSYNVSDKLNCLLLDMLLRTGQLKAGQAVTLDFDHEFIPAEKYDALYSYKKEKGYFHGVATVGGLIVGVENRGITIARFRADCGSHSKEIVRTAFDHSIHFYIRASNCQSRLSDFEGYEG